MEKVPRYTKHLETQILAMLERQGSSSRRDAFILRVRVSILDLFVSDSLMDIADGMEPSKKAPCRPLIFANKLVQSFSPSHNFQDFLGNCSLTSFVIGQREPGNQITSIFTGIIHRGHTSGQLTRRRLL